MSELKPTTSPPNAGSNDKEKPTGSNLNQSAKKRPKKNGFWSRLSHPGHLEEFSTNRNENLVLLEESQAEASEVYNPKSSCTKILLSDIVIGGIGLYLAWILRPINLTNMILQFLVIAVGCLWGLYSLYLIRSNRVTEKKNLNNVECYVIFRVFMMITILLTVFTLASYWISRALFKKGQVEQSVRIAQIPDLTPEVITLIGICFWILQLVLQFFTLRKFKRHLVHYEAFDEVNDVIQA